MDLYLFDICDTLYKTNTTFGYINFVLKQTNSYIKYSLLWLISSRLSPFYYLSAFVYTQWHFDLPKLLAIRYLKGFSKNTLYELGVMYFEQDLKKLQISKTHNMLNKLKKEGKEIILISSSLDPVVNSIATSLNVKYFSSLLEYKSNVCTGKIKKDLTGKKHDILIELNELKAYESVGVISDNYSDLALLKMADEKWVVLNSNKMKKKWGNLDAHYLNL